MIRDIRIEDLAQRFVVVHSGRIVLIHGHRLAKEFLRDPVALRELHEPTHIMPEGLQADIGHSGSIHQFRDLISAGIPLRMWLVTLGFRCISIEILGRPSSPQLIVKYDI